MFDFSSGKWTFFKAHTEKKEKWGWGGRRLVRREKGGEGRGVRAIHKYIGVCKRF